MFTRNKSLECFVTSFNRNIKWIISTSMDNI